MIETHSDAADHGQATNLKTVVDASFRRERHSHTVFFIVKERTSSLFENLLLVFIKSKGSMTKLCDVVTHVGVVEAYEDELRVLHHEYLISESLRRGRI